MDGVKAVVYLRARFSEVEMPTDAMPAVFCFGSSFVGEAKAETGIGSDLYFEGMAYNASIPLGEHATVDQLEIMAESEGSRELSRRGRRTNGYNKSSLSSLISFRF